MTATLGALGGPHTFGGQAANLMVRSRPDMGEVVYLPSSPELFADDRHWRVGAACVPAHTSKAGAHVSTHRRLTLRDDMFVVAEVDHEYHCALLVKPGTQLADIRTVLGHTGSLNQSRGWLTSTIPHAELTIVDSHSRGAALMVAAGGGTLAAVGTADLAAETGLDILARDIDGGSVGRYWAVGPRLLTVDSPDRVVVAGTTSAANDLSATLSLLHLGKFEVNAMFSEAVGDRLLHNRVVLYASGTPQSALEVLAQGLEAIPSFRLAGAYALTRAPERHRQAVAEGATLAN
jgi:prephenate dehydratase